MSVSRSVKTQEWKDKLLSQKESGLSIARWCRENRIPYDCFFYWKRRLAEKHLSSPSLRRDSFTELQEVSPESGVQIEHGKIRIHLSRHFDIQTLAKCLRALEGIPC